MSWRHDPERDDVGRHDLLSVLGLGFFLGVMVAAVVVVGVLYLNLPGVK